MTDARLPGPWLSKVWWKKLSDDAFGLLTTGLMWANEAGTDGHIEEQFITELRPRGRQHEAIAELCAVGILDRVEDGIQFVDWSGRLGQSPAADVEARRAAARERSKNYRLRLSNSQELSSSITSDVSSDVTRDVTANVGQDQDEDLNLYKEENNSNNELVTDHMVEWARRIAPNVDVTAEKQRFLQWASDKQVQSPKPAWEAFITNALKAANAKASERDRVAAERERRLASTEAELDQLAHARARADADPPRNCVHGRVELICQTCSPILNEMQGATS